nr:outer envelope pore protein 24B, chloroplastic [Tanacetum cinerariifolium]
VGNGSRGFQSLDFVEMNRVGVTTPRGAWFIWGNENDDRMDGESNKLRCEIYVTQQKSHLGEISRIKRMHKESSLPSRASRLDIYKLFTINLKVSALFNLEDGLKVPRVTAESMWDFEM